MADIDDPRVWITSFWGFDPANEGYLGFTYEGNRAWFLEHWREGDLILIYGADASTTAPEKRHQALGFLEIEPHLIRDIDRMSDVGIQRKVDNNWIDRWTFAVPVIRAAEVQRRISINHIAPVTLTSNRARIIASRGELLTPEEAAVALSLPVSPINVFGMPPLPEGALQQQFLPSRGIRPTFGQHMTTRADGDHFLYALRFDGEASRLLDRQPFELRNKAIFKVGYSNDPVRRCEEMNCGIPPAASCRWKIDFKSRTFESAQAAFEAETTLKEDLARKGQSLGHEFFLCSKTDLSTAFASASASTAMVKIRVPSR